MPVQYDPTAGVYEAFSPGGRWLGAYQDSPPAHVLSNEHLIEFNRVVKEAAELASCMGEMTMEDALRACQAQAEQADADGIEFDAEMLADVVLDTSCASARQTQEG